MKARWKHAERTIKLFSAWYTDTILGDHPNVSLAARCTICQHSASRQSCLSDPNFQFFHSIHNTLMVPSRQRKHKTSVETICDDVQRHARLTVHWKLGFLPKNRTDSQEFIYCEFLKKYEWNIALFSFLKQKHSLGIKMDCMHGERKEQSVFLFFTVKRRKIELILLQAALADYLQEGWANWWSNDNLI